MFLHKVITAVTGSLLVFGALTATTNPASIWNPQPKPTTSTSTIATTGESTIATYKRVIKQVTYTIIVVRKSTITGTDGYAVRITAPGKTLLNLSLTKSAAQRVITLVQQYKPTSQQMLVARILVLALL